MPVPDQVRFLPFGNTELDPNFNRLWQVYDRLPFFPQYEMIQRPATAKTTTTAIQLGTTLTFRKEEQWTDVRFYMDMSMWVTVAPTSTLTFAFVDASTAYGFAPLYFNTASQHQSLASSTQRVTGLLPGKHTVGLYMSRLSGTGTLTLDANDSVHLIAEEILPLPSN